jgi:hypothetical protein
LPLLLISVISGEVLIFRSRRLPGPRKARFWLSGVGLRAMSAISRALRGTPPPTPQLGFESTYATPSQVIADWRGLQRSGLDWHRCSAAFLCVPSFPFVLKVLAFQFWQLPDFGNSSDLFFLPHPVFSSAAFKTKHLSHSTLARPRRDPSVTHG